MQLAKMAKETQQTDILCKIAKYFLDRQQAFSTVYHPTAGLQPQPVARLKYVYVRNWHAAAIVPPQLPAVKRSSVANPSLATATGRFGRLTDENFGHVQNFLSVAAIAG